MYKKDTFKVSLMSRTKRNSPEDRMGKTGEGKSLMIQLTYGRAKWKARCPLRNRGTGELKGCQYVKHTACSLHLYLYLGLFIVAWLHICFCKNS